MTKEEAVDVSMMIVEYETERDDTMYNGEGKQWIVWFIQRLYEHGFEIKEKE